MLYEYYSTVGNSIVLPACGDCWFTSTLFSMLFGLALAVSPLVTSLSDPWRRYFVRAPGSVACHSLSCTGSSLRIFSLMCVCVFLGFVLDLSIAPALLWPRGRDFDSFTS